uniref:DNA primase/polymerase bifunctional N-terminal domain-containing protein n=1 Tax=Bornetia secundiflora TaxID=2575637 RepID=A0A4D6WNA0_9FLOR|nr:hypothetical protein [Bornetia secundiflora]
MHNTSYNIHKLIIHIFLQIPQEIRLENRFCLWKYAKSSHSVNKLLKKPYGINSSSIIIPSLKERKYWFNLSQLNQLSVKTQKAYGLGLVLNESNYVVIDLDKCISIENNALILSHEIKTLLSFFPKAYCEISPSNTGLHIIFRGQWLFNSNKAKQYIYEDLKKGTIEVYSGNDCRYITLTGNSINLNLIQDNLPYYSCESQSLQKIYKIFFSMNKSSYGFKASIEDSSQEKIDIDFNVIDRYLSIRTKILNSKFKNIYLDLCEFDNPKYKSISEADWSYLSIVFKFLEKDQEYTEKYNLLEYFYKKDRPERRKKKHEDYVKSTIEKILNLSSYEHRINIIKNSCEQKNQGVYKTNIQKIDKFNIIKICNAMNIYHFGRTLKNLEYKNFKVDIPQSLNQTDFRYYIEILFQYIDQLKYCSDINLDQNKFLLINVNLIFKKLNISSGGKSYYSFTKTLNKLSDVILMYDKKITSDGLRSIYKESLISYKILYKQSNKKVQSESLSSFRKLAIKMHPIILDMYKKANYNYSLFNRDSYNKITSDKLKLLYYYFCCLTFPGCNYIHLTIDELLLLFWPKTNVKQLISQRKKEIIRLLKEFMELKPKLDDLELDLMCQKSEIIGVQVKKHQLLPV